MTSNMLLEAMTDIDNTHILSAKKQLGYGDEMYPKNHRRFYFRRCVALVAAVAILLSISCITAMAVSPEFRELVFRFLHIEQEQIIPETPVTNEVTPEDMFAEPIITIGGVIDAQCIHTPVAAHAQSGTFLVCTDEIETNQGSHYDAYYEYNGEFVKLEEQTFQQDYSLQGVNFYVEFDWAVYNGNVIVTWVEANEPYVLRNAAGDASSVLHEFIFTDENGSESRYPVLLNLYTGELVDVLSGTGAENFCIYNSAISADKTKMLLARGTADGEILYYVDLVTRQMHSIDSLSGEHANSCTLIDNTLVCWKLSDGYYTAWRIDLTNFQRTELFAQKFNAAATPERDAGIVFLMGFDGWIHQGSFYAGSSFALEVDEAQQVSVIDLATGMKTQIPGFIWTEGCQMIPSADGSKLLLAGGPAGENFDYVGVLDYEAMTFVEFSREHLSNVQEHIAYWFDENTVVIHASATPDSLCSDFYLYSLEDIP